MVAQEGSPILGWRSLPADHVLGDRRLGDFEPTLKQFAVDARAPHNGFSLLIRRIRSRSSRSILGLPGRPWDFQRQLNNFSQTEQAWPEPRHPHQKDPVTPVRSKNSSEALPPLTLPPDGNNAKVHPVARGIEQAFRVRYLPADALISPAVLVCMIDLTSPPCPRAHISFISAVSLLMSPAWMMLGMARMSRSTSYEPRRSPP